MISALENNVPDYKRIIEAIDIFFMSWQSAHLPKGKKPKSMLPKEKVKQEKPFFMQKIKDKETGEEKLYKVYL